MNYEYEISVLSKNVLDLKEIIEELKSEIESLRSDSIKNARIMDKRINDLKSTIDSIERKRST